MAITGSEIIVEALMQEGVEVVFGYPGGCVLDIFDALEKEKGIRKIIVRHEREENVWPMIPAGKSVEESISGLA